MDILAFASFAILVVVWLVAPTKSVAVEHAAPVEQTAAEPAAA
jgi:hypothetical protein